MSKSRKKGRKKKSKPSSFSGNTRLHLLIIAILGFGLYANTLFHEYTLDDAIVIYDNMFTTEGLEGVPGLLGNDTFYGFFKEEGKARLVAGGRYRPLTPVLFAIEWALFGNNPFVGHLLTVLWYVATCLILYLFLKKALSTHIRKEIGLFAFTATILFVSHPVHTEVVANIKGRDEILTLLGSLTALWCMLQAVDKKTFKWHIYGALALFFGLLAKETAATMLLVLPLTLILLRKKSVGQSLQQIWPYALAFVAFMVLRGSIIGWSFGDSPIELMNNPFVKVQGNSYVPFSTGEKLSTILYTLGKYVQLLLFPHPLTHDYYPRHIPIMDFGNLWVWGSLLIYLAIAWGIWKSWRKNPVLAYALSFYLITLSIVSNIVFPVGTNMSERFLFMPSVGFVIALSLLLFTLREKIQSKKTDAFILALAGAITLAYGVKTITRNPVWKDNLTLFTTDIKTSTRSAKLLNATGGELIAQAGPKDPSPQRERMLEEAVSHLEKAIKIHPNYKNAYLQLGNANHYLGNYDQAAQYYNHAIKLDPDFKDAMLNLGKTYRASKQFDKAIDQFTRLEKMGYPEQKLHADLSLTYEEAGRFYATQGQRQKAINYFQQGLESGIEPSKFHYFLGVAFAQQQNISQSLHHLESALKFDNTTENLRYIYTTLSEVYKQSGQPAKAAEYAQKAAELPANE